MASEEVIFLKDEKIRQLAELIRGHEINNMFHMVFHNLGEQLEYIRMVNNNEQSVKTILDDCKALTIRYKDDAVRGPIAGDILVYAEHCLNNALQIIRNYTVRRDYLDKMMDHHVKLFHGLEELNTSSQEAVRHYKDSLEYFDQKVMSYVRMNSNSHASQEFSRYLRNVGIGFNELVRSYQEKLGYSGRFEDLEEDQKLEVYAAIIEASGRLNVLDTKGRQAVTERGKISEFGSAAMFMLDVGSIIWDVYTGDHTIQTATRDALILAAKKGGAYLGKLVGTAIATGLTGVQASALFVTAVGLLGGFVGGFIFAAAAGFLLNRIFSSGGEADIPTEGFIVYVAPMPNGRDIAKQIA